MIEDYCVPKQNKHSLTKSRKAQDSVAYLFTKPNSSDAVVAASASIADDKGECD